MALTSFHSALPPCFVVTQEKKQAAVMEEMMKMLPATTNELV